jgi:hypothetical protein
MRFELIALIFLGILRFIDTFFSFFDLSYLK